MVISTVLISIDPGLHARSASDLISFASGYTSKIMLTKDNSHANAKSLLSLISLGLKKGDQITINVDGVDEDEALCGIIEYLSNMNE